MGQREKQTSKSAVMRDAQPLPSREEPICNHEGASIEPTQEVYVLVMEQR